MKKIHHIVAATLIGLTTLFAVQTTAQAAEPAALEAQRGHEHRCMFYTVRRGDTLNSIASSYRSSAGAIMSANNLRRYFIYPGQRLCIPMGPPPGHPPPNPPPPRAGTGNPAWLMELWNNPDLSGGASYSGYVSDVNFDWDYGAPVGGVQADNFSARFTRTVNLNGGRWRLYVTHDDGVRLWVNNVLVLDQWSYQGSKSSYVDLDIPGPNTSFRLEYVERGGLARVQLSSQYLSGVTGQPVYPPVNRSAPAPAPTPTSTPAPAAPYNPPGSGGWVADYFNNRDLSDTPVWSTRYNQVWFAWGAGSPNASVLSPDNFSARFLARPYLSGNYRLVARADDGVRVYVDGVLQIDAWRTQAATTYTRDLWLPSGNHEIKVEYFEASSESVLQFYWEQR